MGSPGSWGPVSTGVDTAEVVESDLRTSASSVPGSGSEPRLDRVCFVGGVIVADSSSSTSSISGNAGSLGRGGHDICLGGNGGGFRKSDGTAEKMLVVVVVIETAPPEHSGEVGTSEDHLQLLEWGDDWNCPELDR